MVPNLKIGVFKSEDRSQESNFHSFIVRSRCVEGYLEKPYCYLLISSSLLVYADLGKINEFAFYLGYEVKNSQELI
ncbi:MAG TPA: hypothetical protein DCE56_39900 [Cyanobacteria bacterium UBA8553]|nr:hypothetical protein [Cyanobacteria bacterium UBA8553]HAJ62506.1 hypothetical protein [Cyanobacteria bacterium UBA8543]